jgi:hypothetical protein
MLAARAMRIQTQVCHETWFAAVVAAAGEDESAEVELACEGIMGLVILHMMQSFLELWIVVSKVRGLRGLI